MINQFVLMCVSVSVCVCARWCVLCLHVGVPDNALLTLWLRDKSMLVRPSWFDVRWEGWLTPWPFCVGWRSSLSGAPVSGLMSDGCSGHAGPWLSDRAGWPPSALTLRPLYGHQLTPPSQSEAGTQDLNSGLYSCCTRLGCSNAPPNTHPNKCHIIVFL